MTQTKEWHYYALNYPQVPYFSSENDGFVGFSQSMPPRSVHRERIYKNEDNHAFSIQEDSGLGMIWRSRTGKGFFHIEVEVENEQETILSVNGTQGIRLLETDPWDAAGQIPKKYAASWNNHVWSFDFASASDFLDIEIVPKHPEQTISVRSIHITELDSELPADDKPTLFLLGDFTENPQIFKESQVLPSLFGSDIRVVNYLSSSRSLKSMYVEGRFNDLIFQARKGDFLLIQSSQNDTNHNHTDHTFSRFGRSINKEMYASYLRDVYLTLARMRGVHVLFAISMVNRTSADPKDSGPLFNPFMQNGLPIVMKKIGREESVPVLDLNAQYTTCPKSSSDHADSSMEQYSRMIVEELHTHADAGCEVCQKLFSYIKVPLIDALESDHLRLAK